MNRDMSGSVRGLIDDMLSGSVAGNIKVETSGESIVTITPTLESGTKIADFTINETSGVLYAPTPEPPIEYTAGTNINISDENVISATDTTYTAGNNITIENGVISASGDLNYTSNEQVIGTYFGKPLYQKSISVPNFNFNTLMSPYYYGSLTVSDYITDCELLWVVMSKSHIFIDNKERNFVFYEAGLDSDELVLFNYTTRNNIELHLTLQYTKTTY